MTRWDDLMGRVTEALHTSGVLPLTWEQAEDLAAYALDAIHEDDE